MDDERRPGSRQVLGVVGSFVDPAPVRAPWLVAHSREMLERLEISAAALDSADFAQVFSGNRKLAGSRPWAACYGGHQFGAWAGQLGDGRAHTLGERVTSSGERWELQLKGSGPTPYSRGADGRAVMRSSVREFLCSEAMHHLGVPTTRALSLVGTGEQVVRDMFYDGNPRPEPGAVVCRVAPTFLRLGNFQVFAARREWAVQRQLLDHTIRHWFPELLQDASDPGPATYVEWFGEVVRRTARLMVEWMRVGFVHGVMNTDNLSILGLTIDYGPYGWLEDFDWSWTPNTTDAATRRYAYGAQPQVAAWNLAQLGGALIEQVGETAPLDEALRGYGAVYEEASREMMAAKLGLPGLEGEDDDALVDEMFEVLGQVETDMTIFFRRLTDLPLAEEASDAERLAAIEPALYSPTELRGAARERAARWLTAYADRARRHDPQSRRRRMARANPKYVLRNYLAQLAIDEAEKGDGAKVMELLEVLRRPYDEQPEREAQYAAKRPEWARHRPGCSMLSCSS
ncbi:MAG: YdiU family protein [Acidobacteria bacterium]|nr:MAG: YdiU family protein [Acidobacteriota bacterium]REK05389.1 MAG: YdiU family protein [Acidobacteriota bacterium]